VQEINSSDTEDDKTDQDKDNEKPDNEEIDTDTDEHLNKKRRQG